MSQEECRSIIERLEVYRESHPHFVAIWRDYLSIKEERFRQAIKDCEGVIKRLNSTEDIDMMTMATIVTILKISSSGSQLQ